MKYKVPFDDHVKEQLGNYSPEVPGHLWDNIKNKKDKRRPFFFFFRNPAAWLFFLLLTGFGVTYFSIDFVNNEMTSVNSGKKTNVISVEHKTFASNEKAKAIGQTTHNDLKDAHISESPRVNSLADRNEMVDLSSNTNAAMIVANASSGNRTAGKKQVSVSEKNFSNKPKIHIEGKSSSTISQQCIDEVNTKNNDLPMDVPNEDLNLTFLPQSIDLLKLPGASLPSLKTVSLPNLNIPCPDNSKSSNSRSYIDMYGGVDYVLRQFTDTPNSSYLKTRKESTSFASAYSAGIRYTKLFGNGFNIRAGLNYSQINEKFKYVQGNIIQVVFIINASGDTIGSYQTSNTRYKTSYNHYKTLDIPVTLGYELTKNKWSLNFNTGLIFNIHSWNQGEVLNESLQPVNISGETSNPYQFKTNIGIGGIGAISLYYSLNDKLSVMAEPYFRYNFSSMNKTDITLKQKYHTSGIKLGIRINLQSGNKK